MAVGAGIASSLGIFTGEATFGTFPASITASKFYEFNSESLKFNKNTKDGAGLRGGGTVTRSNRRVLVTSDASGDFEIDLPTRGLGLVLGLSMANQASPTTLTSGVYQGVYTFGDPAGDNFSCQVKVPNYSGSYTTKTLSGCKITGFELSVANGDIAKGKFTLDAAKFSTSTSAQTPSYAISGAASVYTFAGGTVKIDGTSALNIKDFTLTVENTLKTDRYNLDGTGVKQEQIVNGFRKITGKMTVEFTDTVILTKFLADTAASVQVTLQGALISGSYYEKVDINLPYVKYDADTPVVGGPGPVDLAVTFTAYDGSTDGSFTEPLTITVVSQDSLI